ncbi:MAG: hypothetical protein LQ352_006961 [Teloschistes flavicans]|nr:MAG: hypothetical protein LQ352_006961 [Teloschistes flavicans]
MDPSHYFTLRTTLIGYLGALGRMVRPASRASRASQWIVDGRTIASRASRRASSAARRSTSRRPTIGAPSDFRRVELPRGRIPQFRPLQLSIYLVGNELPALPTFEEEEEEDKTGIVYPVQALVKSRSDSMLSRPSTAFSIPRKPVPSRTVSMDQARRSTESRYTINEMISGVESRSVHRRPSIATSQSTQDFLDALDARLPQSPPALRPKLGPEPVYTLYRRASEQSLRLRTHLEERSQLERQLPDCDTIVEENHRKVVSQSKGLSPILDLDETMPVDDLLGNLPSAHAPSSSTDFPAVNQFAPRSSLPQELPFNVKASRHSVISQWLLRSVGSQASLGSQPSSVGHNTSGGCSGHQPCTLRDRSSTASSTIYSSSTAADQTSPWTTPRMSPHKKNESVSTYHTVLFPRSSCDWEKKPVVVDVQESKPVGIAF